MNQVSKFDAQVNNKMPGFLKTVGVVALVFFGYLYGSFKSSGGVVEEPQKPAVEQQATPPEPEKPVGKLSQPEPEPEVEDEPEVQDESIADEPEVEEDMPGLSVRNYRKLRKDMWYSEAKKIFGRPDGIFVAWGDRDEFTGARAKYTFCQWGSSENPQVRLIFRNGRLYMMTSWLK